MHSTVDPKIQETVEWANYVSRFFADYLHLDKDLELRLDNIRHTHTYSDDYMKHYNRLSCIMIKPMLSPHHGRLNYITRCYVA